MSVLLTGFAPFDGDAINPSWVAVRGLAGKVIAGRRVHALELPTEFHAGPAELIASLMAIKPELCICVGQAGGRAVLSLEKVAINFAHARVPDNKGYRPTHASLQRTGAAAYLAAFPIEQALADLHLRGIPAELSLSAGSYVCNAVYYALLQHRRSFNRALKALFLHIPYMPEQVVDKPAMPSMPVGMVQSALKRMIEVGLQGSVSETV